MFSPFELWWVLSPFFRLKQNKRLDSVIVILIVDNILLHTANSPFLLPPITYSRDDDNFFIYRQNSCSVIIPYILMTSLTEKVLTLQREIWNWSLLERKGLTIQNQKPTDEIKGKHRLIPLWRERKLCSSAKVARYWMKLSSSTEIIERERESLILCG